MTEHPEVVPIVQQHAAERVARAAYELDWHTRNLDVSLSHAAAHHVREQEVTTLVERIAALADVRKRLHQAEAYLTRELGRMVRDGKAPKEGELPDGRRWEAHAPKRRKEWDHEALRHDARQAVVAKHFRPGVDAVIYDPASGEVVDAHVMLAEVQSVHGATAPKVTALDALGLDRDAYSSSYWGPWSVDVTARPDTPEESP